MIGFRRWTVLAVACAASAIACSSSSGSGGGSSGTPTMDGGPTMGGGPGEGGGSGEGGGTMIPPSTDASTSGGATAACYMGSTNTCVSPLDVNACSAAGGTLMSTCPSAGLAGCCTTGKSETCLYAPLKASDANAACTNGMFSTSP